MLIIPLWVMSLLLIASIPTSIVAFLALLCVCHHDKSAIIVLIPTLLFSLLIFIMAFGGTPIYEEKYDRTINLYALDSSNGVAGTFLLGGGTVRDIQYYIGYTNIGEDDYQQVKFYASKSVLRLKDDEIPRAEIYKEHNFRSFFNLILIEDAISLEKAILYIPRDGLKNEYSVNY